MDSGLRASFSTLDQAVLLTVLYADLFDYPLTLDELHGRLVVEQAAKPAVQAAVDRLVGPPLARVNGFICWMGREDLVAVRQRREEAGTKAWHAAHRYARWLRRIPFVRMAAVSGSLAVNNTEKYGDVDFFCITEANRLWIARLFILPLPKITRFFHRFFPHYFCPNYTLTRAHLEVLDHNLFSAHEVMQAVPLWGASVYREFREANPWAFRFLPQGPRGAPMPTPEAAPPRTTRLLEAGLNQLGGDRLNAWLYRLFIRSYRARAQRHGWDWQALQSAYHPDRYTIPEGGYVHVIRDLLLKHARTRLGDTFDRQFIDQIFGNLPDKRENVYDWTGDFLRQYHAEEKPAGA